MKIVIAGIGGRMGRAIAQVSGPEFTVVGATERAGSPLAGSEMNLETGAGLVKIRVLSDPAAAAQSAQAWIDFTTPDATLHALHRLLDTPVRSAVIGTTGFSPEQEEKLAGFRSHFAIVRSGNFSIGVNLMLRLVEEAAKALSIDWDIEISEAHHRYKLDAPSGTALMIGEAAANGRGRQLSDLAITNYAGRHEARQAGAIGMSSRRAGGIVGDHETSFASDAEMLTISHRAFDRSIFARGALRAARWALDAKPGLYSMQDVLSET
ncbi:MAG: 4-hydroxy-tetrahydrodipicolinate reductase [Alphaproteobacteria bacterium]|nr:4-hydroxy-tetrahydrodipicolinate reductase [Alphaproteobacteria bacterium]